MPQVTIIMYHYVRNLSLSRYPDIKGLRVDEFERQLNHLRGKYTFVTVEQCMEAIYNSSPDFPENAVLLTFDDGYIEHFTEVFPILEAQGIQGAFFPPVQAIMEQKMLDVNKIHFILAAADNPGSLAEILNQYILDLADEYELKDPSYYQNNLADNEHRYDPPEIVYVKRLLQRELPEEPRNIILDELFKEIVGVDENIFAQELYMNPDQIKCMIRHGMFFGGHGYSHKWLNAIPKNEKKFEVKKTKEFLNFLGMPSENWVMCYPYGAYDDSLIQILREQNCVMGISTEVGVAQLDNEHSFNLQRFDTNDFPK